MRYLCSLIMIAFTVTIWSQPVRMAPENAPGYLGESEYYRFYSHFWLDMHHFFKHEALVDKVTGSSVIVGEIWKALSIPEQQAIAYYRENLFEEDLRTSDYMLEFRAWVIEENETELSSVPDTFKTHAAHLLAAETIYRRIFWPEHQAFNRNIFEANLPWIKNTEKEAVEKLSYLTRSYWQPEKIRVDITFFAKATPDNMRNRPYTSLGPTHVVMNASEGADEPKGNWLEMLYHESSHHLIGGRSGFVGGTIRDVAETAGEKRPRSLWHAYLFYFSGVVTRSLLKTQGVPEYELYMSRHQVFSRYFPAMESHLPDYIERKISLADATLKILQVLNVKNRKRAK